MPEVEVGTVSDFFAHPVVAGIDLSDNLQQGNIMILTIYGTQSSSRGMIIMVPRAV